LDHSGLAAVDKGPLPPPVGMPVDIPPPHPLLALTEVHRVVIEAASLSLAARFLDRAPRGDGHPVMVLPGFLGSDGYTASLRRYLTRQGYAVHGWGLGRNLGPREGVLEGLLERIKFLCHRYKCSVSLIGHSLGGIFARELARETPDRVRQVISLGSPFGEGRWTGSYPSRLFSRLNPPEDIPVAEDVLPNAPPVPTTAIYSRGDGIVNWRTARQHPEFGHAYAQSIEVRGSHCGMTLNPSVWFLLAERLSQPVDGWQPFERRHWTALVYPAAAE